jgi:hypothetical protein
MLMVVRSKSLLVMGVRVIGFGLMETLMVVGAIMVMLMYMDMFMAVRVTVRVWMDQVPMPMLVRMDVRVFVGMPVLMRMAVRAVMRVVMVR